LDIFQYQTTDCTRLGTRTNNGQLVTKLRLYGIPTNNMGAPSNHSQTAPSLPPAFCRAPHTTNTTNPTVFWFHYLTPGCNFVDFSTHSHTQVPGVPVVSSSPVCTLVWILYLLWLSCRCCLLSLLIFSPMRTQLVANFLSQLETCLALYFPQHQPQAFSSRLFLFLKNVVLFSSLFAQPHSPPCRIATVKGLWPAGKRAGGTDRGRTEVLCNEAFARTGVCA